MDPRPELMNRMIVMLLGVLSVIAGVALFRLIPWSRMAALIFFGANIAFNIANNYRSMQDFDFVYGYLLLNAMMYGLLLFYLTRPKVREQFY
jgi:hypothetical protein